ncbi:hypothetical protein MTO96_039211 [Rhipicephalus appendiculatus]
MLAVYGELGLPRATPQNLLFPACRREHIKRALSALLDFVDGSGLRPQHELSLLAVRGIRIHPDVARDAPRGGGEKSNLKATAPP